MVASRERGGSELGDASSARVILLAGGRSSRLGTPKGLFLVGEREWLEVQLLAFARAGGTRATIVLGYDADAYEARLPWVAAARRRDRDEVEHAGLRVRVVINLAPEAGTFSSVRCGVRSVIEQGEQRAFVLPVDVPCPGTPVWSALTAAMEGTVVACVPAFGPRPAGGHPVLVGRRMLERIAGTQDGVYDARLDRQLQALGSGEIARVRVDDPRVTMNLNTPRDWAEWAAWTATYREVEGEVEAGGGK